MKEKKGLGKLLGNLLKGAGSVVKGVAKGAVSPLPLSMAFTKSKEVKENPTAENISKHVVYLLMGVGLVYLLIKGIISEDTFMDMFKMLFG